MEKRIVKFSAVPTTFHGFESGNKGKQGIDYFHECLNSDSQTLFIYRDALMTEEQTKALHDFFVRRCNINADPVEWLNLSKFILILKIDKLIHHNFSRSLKMEPSK